MQNRRVSMKSISACLLAAIMALPLSAVVAGAGETRVASPQWKHHAEVDDLKKQVQELQRKIEAMEQKQVERKDTGDEWYDDVIGSIKKGQRDLTWVSADGNYKMRMRLRGQFLAQYEDSDSGDDSLGYRIRRARISWDGHAFVPWFKYKFQMDFSKDAELKDMRFDFAYNKKFVPRVGQYKVPFNRETLNSSSALLLVGRSEVESEFTFDRDIGIGLWGEFQDMVRYELGLFQGEGDNVNNDSDDTGQLWAGRVQFSPIGNDLSTDPNFTKEPSLAFGLAVAGINVETDGAGDLKDSNLGGAGDRIIELGTSEAQVVSWTGDVNFKHPLFNIEGEYIGRWVDPDDGGFDSLYDQGFRVQGGVFVVPNRLELAGRFAYIAFDDEVGDRDNLWEVTPGINYYLSENKRWKIQVDYSFIREEDVSGEQEDTNRLRAQLQAYF